MTGPHEAVCGLVHCTIHMSLSLDTKGTGGQATLQENCPGGPVGRIRCCICVKYMCVCVYGGDLCVYIKGECVHECACMYEGVCLCMCQR